MEVASIPKHATCEVVNSTKVEWSIRTNFHTKRCTVDEQGK